jgi:hypothetical protein
VLVEQLADPLPVGRAHPGPRLRRAEEQVGGDHQREQAERAGQDVVEVAAGVGRPLHRAVDADQLVHHVLEPLEERVVRGERADRKVAEADRHVRYDQEHEDPQHVPPGARVTDRVKLAVEKEQPDEQDDRHEGGDGGPVREVREMLEVDDDIQDKQRQDGLPGPALAPPQPEGEQHQQQSDEDVGGAGDIGEGAGHERLDLVELVNELRLEDRKNVGQANEEHQQRRDPGEPRQMLVPLAPPWASAGLRFAVIGRVALAHLRSLVRPRTTEQHSIHGVTARCRSRDPLKMLVTTSVTFSTPDGEQHRPAFPSDTVPPTTGI